jgi:hypothetical protein
MGVVAIDGLLSLTLGRQRVIIMVISMILDFGLWMPILNFQRAKSVVFQSTMGNIIFLVSLDPVCHFLSFQCLSSTLIHQGRRSRKRIIEKEPDLMEKSLRQS